MTMTEATHARPDERLGIVIVTYNRVETLLPTLERLRALEAPYPIVIVDNGSTDGTFEAVRRIDPSIDIILMPRNLGGGARNYGVRALDREFIAFADDDSWWTCGSLARAIELFDAHPRLALIMSRVLAGPEERLDACCELMSRSPLPKPDDVPGVPILGFLACGVVLRRNAFLEVDGFVEQFRTGGEEAVVAMELARNGWALSYIDELVTHHHPSRSRDVAMRRIEGICVDLWLTWMRRSPQRVWRVSMRVLRQALSSTPHRVAIRHAIWRFPRIARQRRPVPAWLEAQLVLLDRQNGTY
jgi:N-acetylglucosaminyl-diphospho-decaprenol L-rhamnosyltransferase